MKLGIFALTLALGGCGLAPQEMRESVEEGQAAHAPEYLIVKVSESGGEQDEARVPSSIPGEDLAEAFENSQTTAIVSDDENGSTESYVIHRPYIKRHRGYRSYYYNYSLRYKHHGHYYNYSYGKATLVF